MNVVPIQEVKEELEFCSKSVSKTIWGEYFKDDSPFRFRTLFTTEQFGVILALINMYSSSLILEFYEHISTANLPAPSTHPEPQDVPDEHYPSIP